MNSINFFYCPNKRICIVLIRADSWLLEEEEEHLTLKAAVQEGLDSGILVGFDPGEYLTA